MSTLCRLSGSGWVSPFSGARLSTTELQTSRVSLETKRKVPACHRVDDDDDDDEGGGLGNVVHEAFPGPRRGVGVSTVTVPVRLLAEPNELLGVKLYSASNIT